MFVVFVKMQIRDLVLAIDFSIELFSCYVVFLLGCSLRESYIKNERQQFAAANIEFLIWQYISNDSA